MDDNRFQVALRIIVEDPIPGLAVALQRGQGDQAILVTPAEQFVTAAAGFVYLAVGRYAGQDDAAWAGRVKVPLGDIRWDAIEKLELGARLTARIAGRSPKGGPALASVRILPPGWVGI